MNVGHLYVVNTTLTRPPKDKLVICVCPASKLFIWINTLPRQHGVAQLQLAAVDHGALTHECYLDCSRVTTFLKHELDAALDRGRISPALAQRIVAFVQAENPKTLTPAQLSLIGTNLGAL